MNLNKNISIWRGDSTPPTNYHFWIKSNGLLFTFNGEKWVNYVEDIPTASLESKGLMSSLDKVNLEECVLHLEDTSNPHHVSKELIGLGNVTNDAQVKRSELGVTVATLNDNGKVAESLLPSYVDDILEGKLVSVTEFTLNAGLHGEVKLSGVIYLDTTTNTSYRWSGSQYVMTGSALTLGEGEDLAFPGNRGVNLENLAVVTSLLSEASEDKVTIKVTLKSLDGKSESTDNVDIRAATTTKAGVMSAEDKTKLDNVATGAEVNVQSDWNVTDAASDAFIKNKPTSMPASDVSAWAKAATKPTYTKTEVGLGNVDNTSDADKPVSTATLAALDELSKDIEILNILSLLEPSADITKDLIVEMNDGTVYSVPNIDWTVKGEGNPKAASVNFSNSNFADLWVQGSEYLPKFKRVISYGDLSSVDSRINIYLIPGKIPHMWPNNAPDYELLLPLELQEPPVIPETNIPREFGLSNLKLKPGYDLTFQCSGNIPFGIFYLTDFEGTQHDDSPRKYDHELTFTNVTTNSKLGDIFYETKLDPRGIHITGLDGKVDKDGLLLATNANWKWLPAKEDTKPDHWSFDLSKYSVSKKDFIFKGSYIGEDRFTKDNPMDMDWFGISLFSGYIHLEVKNLKYIKASLPKATSVTYIALSPVLEGLEITELGNADVTNIVNGCPNIRYIKINMSNVTNAKNMFWAADGNSDYLYKNLTEVKLEGLKSSIDLSNLAALSLESVRYIFINAVHIANKTITLYTDVYNKVPKKWLDEMTEKGWTVVSSDGFSKFGETANALKEDINYLDSKLVTKVDKVEGKGLSTNDFTNEYKAMIEQNSDKIVNLENKHAQFALPGFWRPDGTIGTDTNYYRTGLIPINKKHDITVNVAGTKNVAALAMFDAQRVCILYRKTTDTESTVRSTITVQAADIPSNAVYFSTCTFIGYDNLAKSSWSNGDTMEARESAVYDVVQRSKKLLFIDQWKSLSKVYNGTLNGSYDAATDKFNLKWEYKDEHAKKYMPSVTYESAVAMMQNIRGSVLGFDDLSVIAPANLPPKGYQAGSGPYFYVQRSEVSLYNQYMEVLILATQANGYFKVFQNPIRLIDLLSLKAVIGIANTESSWNPLIFSKGTGRGFPKLEFFRAQIKQSFDVRTSPLLTLDTMQYLVTNAQNTEPIAVTVHPDVYAKLTGDTTNAAAAALTAEELAQWQALVTTANSKNISFATPE